MTTKNFSKNRLNLPLPELLAVQKESWKKFWETDLKELFEEFSPIQDHSGKKLELYFVNYKLESPRHRDGLEARQNNGSFEAPFRVRVKLVNLKTKESKEQEIFMCNFPLMTPGGTFVVNGVERVTIAQLIRSPGVFFTLTRIRDKDCFGAKIIPNRGAWLEFETDYSGAIGVKIDRKRKIAATTLLRAFGVQEDEMKKLFERVKGGETDYLKTTLARDPSKSPDQAWVEIYERLRPGESTTPENAREFVENMFFNFRRYDLSRVGRWKTGERLPETQKGKEETITLADRILKKEDLIATLREIIRLNSTPGSQPDQIDHLGNRRVRVFSELLLGSLRIGLARMERIIKDRMAVSDMGMVTPAQVINPRPFMIQVQRFFSSSQLSQFMDGENPLAELEHKRRIAATGPGGLTRERAGFEVRDVQSSHYGRICPIETPEGPNVGLINHLTMRARIHPYGFIETPYFRVKRGRVTKEVVYFTAYEEEKYIIASGSTSVNKAGKILLDKVEARVHGEPALVDRRQIEFIDVSPEQSLSVAASAIPFLQNDDANRALMGSNMQRQAVPLLVPEPPLVLSGIEKEVASASGQNVVCEEEGAVVFADGNQVIIKPRQRGKERVYSLQPFTKTNQDTCFHQRGRVRVGQQVRRGDILAEGGAMSEGRLALGRNILVAFMPWRGANFEDAMVASERLLKEDVLTSIQIKSYTCKVRQTKIGPEITTWDIPNVAEEKLKDLDEEGIVRIGAAVTSGDLLVGKISPKGEVDLTAEERLLKAIFGEKAREVKDTSLVMKYGEGGRVVGIRVFSRDQGHELDPGVIKRIDLEVAQLRGLSGGDKLANRHGNKGVVAKILPEEEMPFLEDGTPIDLILNPTGVGKRMNIGQIFETHLGFAAKKLGYRAISPSFSGANAEDIHQELQQAGLPVDGKITLFDGRSGEPFAERVTVGYLYMFKLIHMVEDKIHARSIGPYSLITQQPLGGKAQFGGQRFGEMEVWALEGYGAAYCLQEMLTIKSDDVPGRAAAYQAILKNEEIIPPTIPSSFSLLVNELKALGLNVEVKEKEKKE